MTWKQPIPTNLETIFGDDYRPMALFRHLIYKSCNKDGYFTDKRGKTTPVKRGQVVFGRNQFGKELGWVSKTCDRNLIKIEKTYKQVTMQRNTNFTIVTILNYEELVDMSQQMSKQCPSNVQAMSTSKSVKSDKSVNNTSTEVNTIASTYKEKINSGSKLTPSSIDKIKQRLKTFSLEEINIAIEKFSKDSWWMENNANRGIAWFFNSDDRVDQFINLKAKVKSGDDCIPVEEIKQ